MSNKYTNANAIVTSVLASDNWQGEDILTVPDNYQGPLRSNEFVRVSVLMPGSEIYYGDFDTIRGQLIVDIYTEAGYGPTRAFEIASIIDSYFQAKSLQKTGVDGTVQTTTSNLSTYGIDRDNPSLFHSRYTLGFTYHN